MVLGWRNGCSRCSLTLPGDTEHERLMVKDVLERLSVSRDMPRDGRDHEAGALGRRGRAHESGRRLPPGRALAWVAVFP